MEGGEAFGGFGLDGYVVDGGQAGAGVGPVDQAPDVLGRAFEDRFDPAVGQVAHPAGHAVLLASSDLPEVVRLADRVLVLREGTLAGTLTGDDISQLSIMQLAVGTLGAAAAVSAGVTNVRVS